jgi:hypothetical protein
MQTPVSDKQEAHPIALLIFWNANYLVGQRERPWFIMNLARGARFLKLGEWTEIRVILLRFFYIDRIDQKCFQEAWHEARMLMDMLGT